MTKNNSDINALYGFMWTKFENNGALHLIREQQFPVIKNNEKKILLDSIIQNILFKSKVSLN